MIECRQRNKEEEKKHVKRNQNGNEDVYNSVDSDTFDRISDNIGSEKIALCFARLRKYIVVMVADF